MRLFQSLLGRRLSTPLHSPLTLVELEPRCVMSVNVLTYHNDNARTGQNLNETILTPANVNATDFGQLFTDSVDGAIYAQPLYVSGVAVPGQGTLNLVFVATENDSVYAFNADSPGPPVWQDSFINPAAGVTPVSDTDLGTNVISPEVGITGTPVIDPTTNTLYVVAFTKELAGGTTTYVQRLHALDLATGAEKFGGPVVIQATVPGTAPGSSNGVVSFDAFKQNQRPGLLLDNGVVYIAWASFDDHTPYNGWVIGYDAQTLQQVAVFNDSPNAGMGGIWQSGDAPAADAASNIYLATGTGDFDANSATAPNNDYGDTDLELAPTPGGLSVVSYFTPFNQPLLNARDEDLGSGGVLLLPAQPGESSPLMISVGKEGKIYLLDRNNLGGFNPSLDNVVQELPGALTGLFGAPAYFNGQVYFGGVGEALQAFAIADGLLSTVPTSESSVEFGYPGTTPSISADGNANGIVWAIQDDGTAILRAYPAGNLGTELYDSTQDSSRDQLADAVKFAVPTVVNGKVYVGTQTGLSVFGLLPAYLTSDDYVTQVYQDLLGRVPDSVGLAYWTNQMLLAGQTRQQIALGIENSLEYQTDEVRQVYAQFLHRVAGATDLSYWTGAFQTGATLQEVEAGVAGSAEFFQNSGGGTNAGFLNALYQDVLGRPVDATGLAYWSQELANGVSTTQVAAGVLSSEEYLLDLVQNHYQQFLRRPADLEGLVYWYVEYENEVTDEQVIAGIIGSQEYLNRLL